MSVYKRCSRERLLDDGTPNPWFGETSPRCEYHWHYYFRVNGRRYRAQNRRTRILSADEQLRLLDACKRRPKLQALLKLALITGARIGELLALRWEDCQDGYLTFWDTKNGKVRRIPHHGHDRRSLGLQAANTRGSSPTPRPKSRTPRFGKCSSARFGGRRSQQAT
jgi:integrase